MKVIRMIIIIIALTYSLSVLAEVHNRLYQIIDYGILIDLIINLIAALLGGLGNAISKTKNPDNITEVKRTIKQDLALSLLAGFMFFFGSLEYLDNASTQLVLVMIAGWLGGSGIEWIIVILKGRVGGNYIQESDRDKD